MIKIDACARRRPIERKRNETGSEMMNTTKLMDPSQLFSSRAVLKTVSLITHMYTSDMFISPSNEQLQTRFQHLFISLYIPLSQFTMPIGMNLKFVPSAPSSSDLASYLASHSHTS